MKIGAAKSAGLIGYFGYGSLVNRDTHRTQIVDAFPARLSGWRRIWQPQEDGQFTDQPLLTVFPHLETHIDGLLVIDKAENLAAVDQREINYDRVEISADALNLQARQSSKPQLPAYQFFSMWHGRLHQL